jgi:hypothetical protein
MEKICSQCGKCCTWTYQRKEYRCRYLTGKIGILTSCSIYDNPERINSIIALKPIKVKCMNRKDYPIKIEGCSYI